MLRELLGELSFDTLGFHSLLTSHAREQTQWIFPLDISRYVDYFHMGRMHYSDFYLLKLMDETFSASILFNTLHVLENSTTVSEICERTLLFTVAFDSDFIRLLGHMNLIENCHHSLFLCLFLMILLVGNKRPAVLLDLVLTVFIPFPFITNSSYLWGI